MKIASYKISFFRGKSYQHAQYNF